MAIDDHLLNRRAFLIATAAAAAAAACGGGNSAGAEPATDAAAESTTPAEPTPSVEPTVPADPTLPPEPTAPAEPTQPPEPERDHRLDTPVRPDHYPLGIASGDPTPDSVILWTKAGFAPDPTNEVDLVFGWAMATDAAFETVIATGDAIAVAALGNSVHVNVADLEPNTEYWYKFFTEDATSPVGHTRTLPSADSSAPVRFAFSSCQNWEHGYYSAHRHLAADANIDLFFWLGDYIYEYGPTEFPFDSVEREVRVHDTPEVTTLEGYRGRYALYKSDPDLQAHHAARPWIVTWDDHEVDNDHARDVSEDGVDPADFERRRADAYQAWYEHMPVRLEPPAGSDYPIHRNLHWGSVVQWLVLDGRQYRDDQPTDGEFVAIAGLIEDESVPVRKIGLDALDPERRMLGADQQEWLTSLVTESTQTWTSLAQQVIMMGVNALPGSNPPLTFTDTWDGYAGNRNELLSDLSQAATNLVVLTGDFHAAAVGDLRADPYDQDLPVVATEFMATSISSRFLDIDPALLGLLVNVNPHVKFFDSRKGYTVCEVDNDRWVSRYFAVDDAQDPDSGVAEIVAFEVMAGAPGAVQISG